MKLHPLYDWTVLGTGDVVRGEGEEIGLNLLSGNFHVIIMLFI